MQRLCVSRWACVSTHRFGEPCSASSSSTITIENVRWVVLYFVTLQWLFWFKLLGLGDHSSFLEATRCEPTMVLIADGSNVAYVLSALCREVFEIPSDWNEKRWCLHATRSGHACWKSEVTAQEQCVRPRRHEYLRQGYKSVARDAVTDVHREVDKLEGKVERLEESLANVHERLQAVQASLWISASRLRASNLRSPSEMQQSSTSVDAERIQHPEHSTVLASADAPEMLGRLAAALQIESCIQSSERQPSAVTTTKRWDMSKNWNRYGAWPPPLSCTQDDGGQANDNA